MLTSETKEVLSIHWDAKMWNKEELGSTFVDWFQSEWKYSISWKFHKFLIITCRTAVSKEVGFTLQRSSCSTSLSDDKICQSSLKIIHIFFPRFKNEVPRFSQ